MFKIAIIGPESTGKSELSVALATHFMGKFVPEFARTYVENLGREYTYEDVVFIAKKQIEEQQTIVEEDDAAPVFFDTELIITKVWLEYSYKKVPEFLITRLAEKYFDLYLICYPDLPWIPDTVREHGGDERSFFFEWYKREALATGIPCVEIKGTGNARTKLAVDAVASFF